MEKALYKLNILLLLLLYNHAATTVCGHRLTLENHVFWIILTENSISSFPVL